MENKDVPTTSRRTRGDGMETIDASQTDAKLRNLSEIVLKQGTNSIAKQTATSATIPGLLSIYRSQNASVKLLAKEPKGKIFYLVPHIVNRKKSTSLKNKEPKFVPFEPYKAAVNPMTPPRRNRKSQKANSKRNNLDLNVLVSQVSDLTMNELNLKRSADGSCSGSKIPQQSTAEKQLKELKEQRDYFEVQLKFQVQVNSELKNLLVAAVGEDLQTKVNVLTEDKLQLARALLNSAHNLSTHTEQIEFLAGQCEVWRSKFLASSLMVEELARWKASLLHKNKLLSESNKEMLETISQIREMQLKTLTNLKFLTQSKAMDLRSANALDITSECLNISENLILHSGIGMPANLTLHNLDTTTPAEKLAIEALQSSNQGLLSTDEAFKAIVDQAFPCTKVSKETQTQTTSSN